MKVLFIYSLDDVQSMNFPLRSTESIQLGISYISSVLKAAGHQVQLLVLGSGMGRKNLELVERLILDFKPGLACFTAVSSQYRFISGIARYIRDRWPEIYLLIGGVHATLNPERVIEAEFDALCIGEGEYPTVELCAQLEEGSGPGGIANLWLKHRDGAIEKTLPRPFQHDLDAFPFPDREIWAPWIKEQEGAGLTVLLGRGCPYDCTYCSNRELSKLAPGKYVRMRSPVNILGEIVDLCERYPDKTYIYLEIETIGLDKVWTVELCRQLEAFNSTKDRPLSFGTNFRISPRTLDEEIFSCLAKANIRRINIGLESGSERIRREVLKRDYSNQDFLTAVSLARKYGMSVCVYNMIGIPGETFQDYWETVNLNRVCQPEVHFTSIFFPYQGTELYDICIKEGLIGDEIEEGMERMRAVLDLPGFSRKRIQRAYTLFHYHVYRGYKPLWLILIRVIYIMATSHHGTNYLFRKIMQIPLLRSLRAKLAVSA